MGEMGGIIVASVGVLLLIGAVNGTWKRAWNALISDTNGTNSTNSEETPTNPTVPNAPAGTTTSGVTTE